MSAHREPPPDDPLAEALEAYREGVDGRSEEAGRTRAAILEGLEAQRAPRTPYLALAATVLLTLALGVPTAWAYSTGRLDGALEALGLPRTRARLGGRSAERAPDEGRARTEQRAPEPNAPPSRDPEPEVEARAEAVAAPDAYAASEGAAEEPDPGPLEAPPVRERPTTSEAPAPALSPPADVEAPRAAAEAAPPDAEPPPPVAVPTAPGGTAQTAQAPPAREEPVTPAETPVDREERLLFERAHDTHFGGGGPAAALAAWDAYLAAYPHGRYEPEARYNRALTLLRLGRYGAAERALRPFASGAFGAMRQREAGELLDALTARAADGE